MRLFLTSPRSGVGWAKPPDAKASRWRAHQFAAHVLVPFRLEATQAGVGKVVRRLIPGPARAAHAQETLGKCIVDRTLHAVPLMSTVTGPTASATFRAESVSSRT